MDLSSEPVTLSVEQIAELNKKLSTLRHNVNNQLALIVAAAELIRANPEKIERMTATLLEQPSKITDEIKAFSSTFESTLNIS